MAQCAITLPHLTPYFVFSRPHPPTHRVPFSFPSFYVHIRVQCHPICALPCSPAVVPASFGAASGTHTSFCSTIVLSSVGDVRHLSEGLTRRRFPDAASPPSCDLRALLTFEIRGVLFFCSSREPSCQASVDWGQKTTSRPKLMVKKKRVLACAGYIHAQKKRVRSASRPGAQRPVSRPVVLRWFSSPPSFALSLSLHLQPPPVLRVGIL